jgi:hypothetical protein
MRVEYTLRIQTTPARLEYQIERAEWTVQRRRNGFQMKSEPIRPKLDNGDFFDEIGIKRLATMAKEQIEAGSRAIQTFMARQAREKNLMSGPDPLTMAEIVRMPSKKQTQLVFIPRKGPKISWEGGTTEVSYVPDELDIQWTRGKVHFQYHPYSVDISVDKQIVAEEKTHAD